MEIDVSLDKKQLKKRHSKILGAAESVVAIGVLITSIILGAEPTIAISLGLLVFFSLRIFKEDVASFTVKDLDLAGLFLAAIALNKLGINLEISLIQATVVFFIGWTLFQVFEDQIGGGDVRLITVAAIFLNFLQLLSAISLAAFIGMLISRKYNLRKIPFASILIVTFWLSYAVVRY